MKEREHKSVVRLTEKETDKEGELEKERARESKVSNSVLRQKSTLCLDFNGAPRSTALYISPLGRREEPREFEKAR